MKFNFEVPAPLQLGVSVSYYENLLFNYRYLEVPYPGTGCNARFFGNCEIEGIGYEIEGCEEAGLINSIQILDARETDSFLDVPLSLPARKFVKALKGLGIEFEHDRSGINIPHEDNPIALSYLFGKVVGICWENLVD